MIIGHELRYVCLMPAHTKSTSMRSWLKQNYGGVELSTSQSPHMSVVPEEYRDYFVFSVIRHPQARARALWSELHTPSMNREWRNQLSFLGKEPIGTIQEFYDALLCKQYLLPLNYWFSWIPQSVLLQHALGHGYLDMTLKYESVPSKLYLLPFVEHGSIPVFPHLHRTSDRPEDADGEIPNSLWGSEDVALWERSV